MNKLYQTLVTVCFCLKRIRRQKKNQLIIELLYGVLLVKRTNINITLFTLQKLCAVLVLINLRMTHQFWLIIRHALLPHYEQ